MVQNPANQLTRLVVYAIICKGFIDVRVVFVAKFPAINSCWNPPYESPNLIRGASTLKQRWRAALHRKRFMTLMAKQDISKTKPWGPGDSRIAVVEHGMFDLNELVVEPNPFEAYYYSQIGSFLWRIRVKINNIWNKQPRIWSISPISKFLKCWTNVRRKSPPKPALRAKFFDVLSSWTRSESGATTTRTLPETNSSSLEINSWRMIFPLWIANFQVVILYYTMLVSRRVLPSWSKPLLSLCFFPKQRGRMWFVNSFSRRFVIGLSLGDAGGWGRFRCGFNQWLWAPSICHGVNGLLVQPGVGFNAFHWPLHQLFVVIFSYCQRCCKDFICFLLYQHRCMFNDWCLIHTY